MTTINRLSSVDTLQGGDQLPVYDASNGDARKTSLTLLTDYVKSSLGSDLNYYNQFAAPSANNFNVLLEQTGQSIWLVITPASALGTGTITLPNVGVLTDDQEIIVVCTNEVINLSIEGNGATVAGAPTYLPPYSAFSMRYSLDQGTWYTMNNTGSGAGSSTGSSETITLTAGQTEVVFTNAPSQASFFINGPDADNGRLLAGEDYVLFPDLNKIVLTQSYPAGTDVTMIYYDASTSDILTTATFVSYTAPGAGAVVRTVESRLSDTVSVKDFGAVGDGVTDDTAAIQAALAASSSILIPPGIYEVSSTITLSSNDYIRLESATIRNTTTTDPVFQFIGAYSEVDGTKDSVISNTQTNGVCVLFGRDTQETNVLWNRLRGVRVLGGGSSSASLSGNIGVEMVSSEPVHGGACYFNTVSGCIFTNLETGIKLGAQCNGHHLLNLDFYRIGLYSIHLVGPNSENLTTDVHMHTGYSTFTALLKVENTNYSTFYQCMGEPGYGRFYDVDANCSRVQIQGHDNFPNASINNSTSAFIIKQGGISTSVNMNTASLTATRSSVNFPDSVNPLNATIGHTISGTDSGSGAFDSFSTELAPAIFTKSATNTFQITGLRLSSGTAYKSWGYYEITVSGFTGGSGGNRTFYWKGLVTPYNHTTSDPRIVVNDMVTASSNFVSITPTNAAEPYITLTISSTHWSSQTGGNLVISVKAVGTGLVTPTITNS